MATPQMLLTSLLYVFIALPCVFSTAVSGQFDIFSKYDLPTGVSGTESAAFGKLSEGPFTTVNDGRILKWQGSRIGFVDFAYTTSTRNITQPGFKADATGRLLRYNPVSKKVTVLLSGLNGGGGPAVSSDGRFVMVPELTRLRISKYWLAGPKANTGELLLNPSGNPNKIKRAGRGGEFWVAISIGNYPREPLVVPQGVRFNSDGVVLQTVSFEAEFFDRSITLVQEQDKKLYVGSHRTTFNGIYSN